MSLAAGTKLGRYEIRSQVGEGGMGQVYLARDPQLDRSVALKILTAEVARDQQRLHRFLQEARAASALSHANAAHIYEIGEAEGMHFIAMEYVEGEGLDRRIGGRPLAVSQILEIAIQIADALDEAHSKGITHRDIKSPNIMITSRGRVKVLDFGLAKLALPAGTPQHTSDSEMATRVRTSPGIVMGTVNYMSPEQALGREVDHRTDIFSFGVVLYEMATGRLPFTGETITETIDRIAHAQPEAIGRLNYDIPPELELIIKKALRKDRGERYQSVHDLLVDLKELRRELDISERLEHSVAPATRSTEIPLTSTVSHPSQTTAAATTSPVPAAHPTSSAEYLVSEIQRHKTGAIIIAALLLIVVAAGGFGVYKLIGSRNQANKPTASAVSSNMKIQRLTSNGKALEAAISPDGKWVVYVQKDAGQRSLRVRQVATTSDVQIVPPADVRIGRETFSPDGNYIYYQLNDQNHPDGVLFQVPSLGGIPRKLLTNIISPITFSPDGNRLAFIRTDTAASGEDQLWIANADGSGERKLAARRADTFFNYGGCGWSPDGKVIACPAGSYSGGFHDFVLAVDAETGVQTDLSKQRFSDVGRVSWSTEGTAVVINAAEGGAYQDQIWSISYPTGEAHRITNDLNGYGGTSLTSDSKTLASVQNDDTANVWIAPTTDPEQAHQITNGKLEGAGLTWTSDGRIVYMTNTNGSDDLSIMNQDGSNQRILTSDPHEDQAPSVSPDGKYVVFTSLRGGFPSLWRMDLDGGNLKQLTDGQEDYGPNVAPDGQWILFSSWRSGRQTLWRISIDGGQPVQLTDKFTWNGRFSPDGKLIACFFNEEQPNTSPHLMILPAAGGEPIKIFDVRPTRIREVAPGWTPDGRSVAYVDSRSGTYNLWIQSLDGGTPKQLTNFSDNGVHSFAFSPDGKVLAFSRGTTRSDVVLIHDFR